MPSGSGTLTVEETAERLGVSKLHLYKLIKSGELAEQGLTVRRLGRSIRFSRAEVARYLGESTEAAS